MLVLEFFEKIRTPFLTFVFSFFSKFGEEYAFLFISLIMLWCINKKYGYCLLFCGILGQSANNFFKYYYKVPRPWVANPDFNVVKSAIPAASGYSFPSGHTQIAMTNYCTVAYFYKKNPYVCYSMIFISLMVGLSRLYLGVHYFSDVLFSVLLGILIVVIVCEMFNRGVNTDIFRIMSVLLSFALFIYIALTIDTNIPNEFDLHSLEFSAKFLGASVAFSLSWYIDEKYIKYSVEGSLVFQVFKLIVGFVVIVLLRYGIKEIFDLFNINLLFGDAIRYFVLVIFAGCVWPYIFNKMYQKK